jgi:hypothetical protein
VCSGEVVRIPPPARLLEVATEWCAEARSAAIPFAGDAVIVTVETMDITVSAILAGLETGLRRPLCREVFAIVEVDGAITVSRHGIRGIGAAFEDR